MTHKDIYTKFMIEYDKALITSSYPSLTKYEVATLLDKAYLALIAQKLTGNNQRGVLFEGDIKAIEDIRPLIKQDQFDYVKEGPASNERVYRIKDDMLYYIQSSLSRLNKVSAIDNKLHNPSNVLLLSHNDANAFKSTSTNLPWMPNPVSYIEGDEIHVLIDPFEDMKNRGSLELTATYIKKPAKFAFTYNEDDSEGEGGIPDEKDTWTITISGDSIVDTKTNTAQYIATVISSSGVESQATFSIISGNLYAYITTGGILTVKDTANDSEVIIKAESRLDPNVSTTKTIVVNYQRPSGDDPVDPINPDDPVNPDDPTPIDPDSEFPIPEAVDLGLSVKWARWNMGAKEEYDGGGYYGWGDSTGKMTSTTSSDYATGYDKPSICGTDLDIATVKWGSGWRLPTEAEVKELLDHSTRTSVTINGVNGYNLTCNGQTIFIPKGGWKRGNEIEHENYSIYWIGELNDALRPKQLAIESTVKYKVGWNKYKSIHEHIRPVYDDGQSSGGDTENEYDKYAVDLGLSSLWSSVNLDSLSNTDSGKFYSWGEAEPKTNFAKENYSYYDSQSNTFTNIGNTISNTEYDAVKAKWGGKWHMPTYYDFQELNEQCTWRKNYRNGVNGYDVEGPSGNSIFLPATGYYTSTSTEPAYSDSKSRYLSGTLFTLPTSDLIPNSYAYAYAFDINDDPHDSQPSKFYRYWGAVIRPVRTK